jgi:serine/threonine-protein kinase
VQERISHYKVEQRLGSGGMGTVFRATDVRDGQAVALKVLRADLTSEPGYVERFRREAAIAGSLTSPQIVRVLDSGQEGETYFIVMEYVEGNSLDKLLAVGPLSPPQAIRFAHQVCRALEEASQRGIVHRDIKPQNILITPDGAVKVTDFGVARVTGAPGITTDGMYLGTPEYMSPEQIDGKTDTRSDIYSLGIVMFQMLTGELPYRGETPWKTLDLHARAPIPHVATKAPEVEPWLDEVVWRCMAKRPQQRYSTPAALAAALEQRPSEALEPRSPSMATRQPVEPQRLSVPSAVPAPRPSSVTPHRKSYTVLWLAGGGLGLLLLAIAVALGSAFIFAPALLAAGVIAFWMSESRSSGPPMTGTLSMLDGRRLVLTTVITTIGRDPANDLVLTSPQVSRRHARIVAQGRDFLLEDAGSQNGTSVNGRRINRVVLTDGDTILIGGEQLRFSSRGPA